MKTGHTSCESGVHRSEAEPGPVEHPPLTDPRIAALLPQELLHPQEIIILLLKPSAWFIVLESLRFLVIVGLGLIAGILLVNRGVVAVSRLDLMLTAGALASMRLLWQLLEWLSHIYVLTDQRVVRVSGVLRVTVIEAQLKQIQHTQAYFSLRERVLGLGTISFATAGTAFNEIHWLMLARPLEVHQTILKAINRYR